MLAEWQKYKAQLQAYIFSKVTDPTAAEDILQDVYIKASTHWHQLKKQASAKSWLYRIAHNQVIDFYRQSQVYDELPDTLAMPTPDNKQQLYRMLSHCLNPMLSELPQKYAVPLVLADLDGLPQREIAEQLNLTLSGAKSRVQRGRQLFRQLMQARCDFDWDQHGINSFTPKRTEDRNFCRSVDL